MSLKIIYLQSYLIFQTTKFKAKTDQYSASIPLKQRYLKLSLFPLERNAKGEGVKYSRGDSYKLFAISPETPDKIICSNLGQVGEKVTKSNNKSREGFCWLMI